MKLRWAQPRPAWCRFCRLLRLLRQVPSRQRWNSNLLRFDIPLAADFVDANLHHGAIGGVTLLHWLKRLAGSVSCHQQIEQSGFFGVIRDQPRNAKSQHRRITSGTGAGTIICDRQLHGLAHFKADPVVFGDIVQLPPCQLAMEVDFSLAIEIVERRDVRLSGSVAGGQTAFGLSGKKLTGVVFTHPENGHSGQASTASSLPVFTEAAQAALM